MIRQRVRDLFAAITFRQWIALLHLALAFSIYVAPTTGTVGYLANMGLSANVQVLIFVISAVLLAFPGSMLLPLLPLAMFGIVGALHASNPASVFYLPGLVALIIWTTHHNRIGRIPITAVLSLYMALLGAGVLFNPQIGAAARVNALYAVSGEAFAAAFLLGAIAVAFWPSVTTLKIATFPLLIYALSIISFALVAHVPASPLAITITILFLLTIRYIVDTWEPTNGS